MNQELSTFAPARAEALQRFGTAVEGDQASFFLIVASSNPSHAVRTALNKAVLALGWEQGPTYLLYHLIPGFSKAYLYEAIEGLDPVSLVLADSAACKLFEEAYGATLPEDSYARLFGRDACAFQQIDLFLESESGKAKLWAALKHLPSCPK